MSVAHLPLTEENDMSFSMEDDDEEEVHVKSKPLLDDALSDDPPLALDDHIEHPPNGGPPNLTSKAPMLEIADRQSRGDSSSLTPLVWTQGEFGLSGHFKIQGKRCTLRLEDDILRWSPDTRKTVGEDRFETLSLADVVGVVAVNSRGRADTNGSQFVIHALKSKPGSCGNLLELVCQPLDPHPKATTQTWTDHLTQQIQNFGHRPRRVYVVINPFSGNRSGWSVWNKVENLFQIANVHTEVFGTQRRFHSREVIQSLDLDLYDGIIVVGGDGTFNEVLNGLMLQTQQTAGVDLRRSRFVPVQPKIRLGIIPAGFSNSIAWSVLGTKDPKSAAAQILLGSSSPIDVCSLFNTGQLLLFSASTLCYGLQSDVAVFSNDFTWLGNQRINIAQFRALISNRNFEAEIMYVPVEENFKRDKCYSRCPKCSDYDGAVESPGVINEKGASLMAAYSNIDRSDPMEWKKLTGVYSTVIACPLTCRSQQAPQGLSPWAHQANGCLDLILVRNCTKMEMAKWFISQRRTTQLDLSYVDIHRVKEFRFRELYNQPHRDEEEINLNDDDEMTNRTAAGNNRSRRNSTNRDLEPTSHWNIDGDDLNRVDIDVRVHRHLLMMFARGIEPYELPEYEINNDSLGNDQTEVLNDSLIVT